MATILSGRWDWWNEYTAKDKIVDCLIMLSDMLGRWPNYKEVAEVWPEYTLRSIQEQFGTYDALKSEVGNKLYRKRQGYRVKESPIRLTFTAEQLLVIREIVQRPRDEPKKRPQAEPAKQLRSRDDKPMTTPKSTKVTQTEIPMRTLAPLEQKKTRPGRKPTFSDEQLLAFLRQIVAANDGAIPTAVRAKELLRKQNGPSLMTMTKRLGPMSGWERRLENAS